MKKIQLILILLFVSLSISCTDNNLSQTLYVDSLGIDYDLDTEEYTIYFHIASFTGLVTSELGSSTTDTIYSIGKAKAKNIYDGLYSISHNSVQNVVFSHIQSVVLTYNFINLENITNLNNIIKTYDYITPNFYIFSTSSDIEEVFSIENPENISSFYSLITNNDYIKTYDMVYYTDFSQGVTEDFRIIKMIDIIATKESWKNENEEITTLYPSGDLYLNKHNEVLVIPRDEYKAITLLNHEYSTTVILNEINFTIYNYKMRILYEDGCFIFRIRGNLYASDVYDTTFDSIIQNFTSSLEDEFVKLINYTKEKGFDIMNLEDFLYRIGKLKSDPTKGTATNFNYKDANIKYDIKFKLFN